MKIYKMTCPSCNGPIQYDPKKPLAFCQYCGAPLYFDDETKRIEVRATYNHNYNYNINRRNETVYEDKSESSKYENIAMAIIFPVVFIVLGFIYFLILR